MNVTSKFEVHLVSIGNMKKARAVVADASIDGDDVKFQPRCGMYVEDQEGLKQAIKTRHEFYQTRGNSLTDLLPDDSQSELTGSAMNAFLYRIKPLDGYPEIGTTVCFLDYSEDYSELAYHKLKVTEVDKEKASVAGIVMSQSHPSNGQRRTLSISSISAIS